MLAKRLRQQAGFGYAAGARLHSFPRAAWECSSGALRQDSTGAARLNHVTTQRVGTRKDRDFIGASLLAKRLRQMECKYPMKTRQSLSLIFIPLWLTTMSRPVYISGSPAAFTINTDKFIKSFAATGLCINCYIPPVQRRVGCESAALQLCLFSVMH